MAHGDDVHEVTGIVNRVDDAILADSDPPEIIRAFQLPASRGPRVAGQPFDAAEDPQPQRLAQSLQLCVRFGRR